MFNASVAAILSKRRNAGYSGTLLTGMISSYTDSGTDLVGSNTMTANNTPGTGTGLVNSSCMDIASASSEYYNIADASAGDFEANVDLAFSCWIKPSGSFASWPRICGKTNSTYYRILVDASGYLGANFGNRNVTYTSATVNAGSWHHVYVEWTQSGGTLRVSLDNSTPASSTGGTGSANAYDFHVGNASGSDANFNGLIDQFTLWDRALTDAERTELYNSGSGVDFLA